MYMLSNDSILRTVYASMTSSAVSVILLNIADVYQFSAKSGLYRSVKTVHTNLFAKNR